MFVTTTTLKQRVNQTQTEYQAALEKERDAREARRQAEVARDDAWCTYRKRLGEKPAECGTDV
jgi:hypothetical protein